MTRTTEPQSSDILRRRLLQSGLAATAASALGTAQFAFAQGTPVRGGQLIVGSPGRPRHFNPALQSGSPMMPAAQLFASPLLIDRNGVPLIGRDGLPPKKFPCIASDRSQKNLAVEFDQAKEFSVLR